MTGKQEAEATITLHEAGFEVSVDQVENDIPEGEVIEQDPSAESEAEKGSTVAITVSLGPGTVKVPKVNGLSVADAKRALEDKGFETEVETRTSSSVPDGKVIGSNPSQGSRIAPGSTVELIASTGVKTAVVPNVLGLDRVSATTQLRKAGFVVNANPTDSDEPEDQVLEQDPPAGEEVEDRHRGHDHLLERGRHADARRLRRPEAHLRAAQARRRRASRSRSSSRTSATPPRTASCSPRRRRRGPG